MNIYDPNGDLRRKHDRDTVRGLIIDIVVMVLLSGALILCAVLIHKACIGEFLGFAPSP